jgi:hypothetical protein
LRLKQSIFAHYCHNQENIAQKRSKTASQSSRNKPEAAQRPTSKSQLKKRKFSRFPHQLGPLIIQPRKPSAQHLQQQESHARSHRNRKKKKNSGNRRNVRGGTFMRRVSGQRCARQAWGLKSNW